MPVERGITLDEIDRLREHCTAEGHHGKLNALAAAGGSINQAAKTLGVSRATVQTTLSILRDRAAKKGEAEGLEDRPVAPGYEIGRRSTLYGPEGETKLEWVRQEPEKEEAFKAALAAIEAACDGLKPVRPTKGPKRTTDELLAQYIITDLHLGEYSWHEECGEDWDLSICEQVLVNGMEDMASAMPDSEQAIFAQMGDFLHWDGLQAVTPTNRHILDADTRYPKLAQLALDVTISVITLLLKKHAYVTVRILEGNHDEAGSVWLRTAVSRLFRDHERCTVDLSPRPYQAQQFGETFLGYHHGHLTRHADLVRYFSSDPEFRPIWGSSKHTYIHSGHYHHEVVREDGGAIVTQHPTLAARDAYAARHGYTSQRGASATAYHKTDGEVLRFTARPRWQ